MAFETISPEKANVIPYSEDGTINRCHVSDTVLYKGAIVKLLSTDKVALVAAVTDVPYGVVIVPNRAVGEEVTVQTYFAAVCEGQADAAVTRGNLLAVSGFDATTKKADYKVAVATNFVSAFALTTAADNAALTVGILRAPYKHT
ncbi:hypothetical protein UFOVP1492_126 [uncultured Caudovirales phage]|uniref:Uncharacterized protein n=1 Tax=uncultured Caudovirales phage TaxID=2100421 RepID=A0A6J5QKD4_9CAUD|nr:hypothetical protein UFOVP1127_8 [uncultured Caudovirales phage]CAB4193364.1 hypothetical protein UFOVP1242_66 [uncultured Caudovirales phage]CAB4217912.1 hypothetical protein UFOVP1492_126 [uncultured Caudovirales phage]CAB5231092.1 hypothetical protein UFOVP1580_19 [uncultured Caudovirales phage]